MAFEEMELPKLNVKELFSCATAVIANVKTAAAMSLKNEATRFMPLIDSGDWILSWERPGIFVKGIKDGERISILVKKTA